MAKAKPTTKREPKVKQGHLDGMEPPRIKALDDAAEIYYDAKKERVTAGESEKQAKASLIEKMKEEGLAIYETPDGLVVTITDKANVKCKRKEDADDEGDDDSE